MENNQMPGGYLVGNSHADGGIKIKTPEGQIEAEGGEVIINKRVLSLGDKFICEGSPKEITSKINEMEGGVSWSKTGSCRLVRKAEDGTEIAEEVTIADDGFGLLYIKNDKTYIVTTDTKDQLEIVEMAINDFRDGFIDKDELENTLQSNINEEVEFTGNIDMISGRPFVYDQFYGGYIELMNTEPINIDYSSSIMESEFDETEKAALGSFIYGSNYNIEDKVFQQKVKEKISEMEREYQDARTEYKYGALTKEEYFELKKEIVDKYAIYTSAAERLKMTVNRGIFMGLQKEKENPTPMEQAASGSILRSSNPEKRPSPSISATIYPAGYRMEGNDGNIWEISLDSRGIHRWKRVKAEDGMKMAEDGLKVSKDDYGYGFISLYTDEEAGLIAHYCYRFYKGNDRICDVLFDVSYEADYDEYATEKWDYSTERAYIKSHKTEVVVADRYDIYDYLEPDAGYDSGMRVSLSPEDMSRVSSEIDAIFREKLKGKDTTSEIHLTKNEKAQILAKYNLAADGKQISKCDCGCGIAKDGAEVSSCGCSHSKYNDGGGIMERIEMTIKKNDAERLAEKQIELKKIEKIQPLIDEMKNADISKFGIEADQDTDIFIVNFKSKDGNDYALTFGDIKMRIYVDVVGEPEESVYFDKVVLDRIDPTISSFPTGYVDDKSIIEEVYSSNNFVAIEAFTPVFNKFYRKIIEYKGTDLRKALEQENEDYDSDSWKLANGGGVGNQGLLNKKYLDSIPAEKKALILKGIAQHYGVSVERILEEVTSNDAEELADYIPGREALEVFNAMKSMKMANGGGVKDLSGNYYSTNDFVGYNNLQKQAEIVLGKDWEAEDDVAQIESIINSLGGGYIVTVAENRDEWNEMRSMYDLAKPTNDSNYDIFVIPENDYQYANGGSISLMSLEEIEKEIEELNHKKDKLKNELLDVSMGVRPKSDKVKIEAKIQPLNDRLNVLLKEKYIKSKSNYANGGGVNDSEELWFSPSGELKSEKKGTAKKYIERHLAKRFGADSMELVGEDEKDYIYELNGNPMMIAAQTAMLEEEKGLDVETYGRKKRVHIPKAAIDQTSAHLRYPLITPFKNGGRVGKFKKGDKVRTRDGNIETVLRINKNGNIETVENDYSWSPDSLTKVTNDTNDMYVAVGEKDGYWVILSKPSTREKAQELLDMIVLPTGETGKIVTLEEAKSYKKIIGAEYLNYAKGGGVGTKNKYQTAKEYWEDLYSQMNSNQKSIYNKEYTRLAKYFGDDANSFSDKDVAEYIQGTINELVDSEYTLQAHSITIPFFKLGHKYIAYWNAYKQPEWWDGIEYKAGGFVGKGELVWRKLNASKRMEFLYENFTPEITPRGQELLVGKDYNFLPRNVKMALNSKYANVEEYKAGGSVGRKRHLYAIMMGKYSQMDNPQYVEVSSRDMDEAMSKFKQMGVDAVPEHIHFSNKPPYYYKDGGGIDDFMIDESNYTIRMWDTDIDKLNGVAPLEISYKVKSQALDLANRFHYENDYGVVEVEDENGNRILTLNAYAANGKSIDEPNIELPEDYYLHAIMLDNGRVYTGNSYYDIVSNQPIATFPIDERTRGYVNKFGEFYDEEIGNEFLAADGVSVSRAKAKRILHEGIAKGHPLTEKQRKFFGARASGYPVKEAAADGKSIQEADYLTNAMLSILDLKNYLDSHNNQIIINGSKYNYYSHGQYNLRVIGGKGAIYNIIPYFPESTVGQLQNAKFYTLLRKDRTYNFAISVDGLVLDIAEDGMSVM